MAVEVGVLDSSRFEFSGRFVGVESQRSIQRPKLPICFTIKHKKSNHSYQIWYFEELDLLVKNSCSDGHSEFHPDFDSFKPISKELFEKILSADVFEVM